MNKQMQMLLFFLLQILLVSSNYYKVLVYNAAQPYAVPFSVQVQQYVDNYGDCCTEITNQPVDNLCYADTTPNPFPLTATGTYAAWSGCVESGGITCDGGELTSRSLITVTSEYGNCSIIADRVAFFNYNDYVPYCDYKWSRTIRACGQLYCAWDDNTASITVECGVPFCSWTPPKISPPPENCTAATPWSVEFEPSDYPHHVTLGQELIHLTTDMIQRGTKIFFR